MKNERKTVQIPMTDSEYKRFAEAKEKKRIRADAEFARLLIFEKLDSEAVSSAQASGDKEAA